MAVLALSLASSQAADSPLLQQFPPTVDLRAPITPVAVGFKAKPMDVSIATPVPEAAASVGILALGLLLILRQRSA